MPDDLRCSWCNITRNKVHNKYNVLESSWNHLPPPQCMEKLSFTRLVPGAKIVGDCWHRQQKFFSLQFWRLGNPRSIWIWSANLVPGKNPLFGFQADILLYLHMTEREYLYLMALLLRALIPFMRAPPSWPDYLPKIPHSNTVTLGMKASTYEFW